MAYAHSPNQSEDWHDLLAHLQATSNRAREFGAAFGGGEAAGALGLWHDLGKIHPEWQSYLHRSAANPALRGTGPEHKLAGALLASRHPALAPFALAIAGHHGGLPPLAELKQRLADPDRVPAAEEALRLASEAIAGLDVAPGETIPPSVMQGGRRAFEHYVRMVFSALVDADFLDTEEHFDTERAATRSTEVETPAELFDRLIADHEARFGASVDASDAERRGVMEARREIFEECLRAADLPPGIFRLTVPTGGGKTRAGMAFALKHAARHGLRRVIVAVPFISITEQTADVYRQIFADAPAGTVLEHHSGVPDAEDEDDDARAATTWSRLATENWDAPIVVTTTVQLLESLFAHRPSHARKLHRIAGSVILLDEVQSLPPQLLQPTLDMLRDLVRHFGVTVVLSTATQPAFEVLPGFADLQATEIVPDPARFFMALQRVRYEVRTQTRQSWDEVAGWLVAEHQALAIVNRKKDAIALIEALDSLGRRDVLHLSTLLCGAHRRWVIAEIRRRLDAGEPCVVVSTQVVEAGVDLDFPSVYRAAGPMDAIIQAAGRCNREGRLGPQGGRVVIFDPAEGGLPLGAYRPASDQARRFLDDSEDGGEVELDSLETIERYYRGLLTLLNTDAYGIQALRERLEYPEVAARYRLIEDDTEAVVVTSYGDAAERAWVASLLAEARATHGNPRRIIRQLQPYIVSVHRREARSLRARGVIEEFAPGLNEWLGEYHPVRGIVTTEPDRVV